MKRLVLCLVLATIAVPCVFVEARADDDPDPTGWKHEIAAAREQIGALVEKARALAAKGREADAQALFERAEQMESAVRQAVAKLEVLTAEKRRAAAEADASQQEMKASKQAAKASKRAKAAKQRTQRRALTSTKSVVDQPRERLLGDVARAIPALHALGREAEAQQLREVVASIAAELHEQRSAHGARERELLKAGVSALVEIDREDLAHRLEHAVHAMELEAEGRDDRKSMSVRRTAPREAEMQQLLRHVMHAWKQQGQDRKAAALARLLRGKGRGAQAAQDAQEGRRARSADRRVRATDRRRRDRDERRDGDEERLAEIEARFQKLQRAIERLERTLDGLEK